MRRFTNIDIGEQRVRKEIEYLKKIDHSNIIKYIDFHIGINVPIDLYSKKKILTLFWINKIIQEKIVCGKIFFVLSELYEVIDFKLYYSFL